MIFINDISNELRKTGLSQSLYFQSGYETHVTLILHIYHIILSGWSQHGEINMARILGPHRDNRMHSGGGYA